MYMGEKWKLLRYSWFNEGFHRGRGAKMEASEVLVSFRDLGLKGQSSSKKKRAKGTWVKLRYAALQRAPWPSLASILPKAAFHLPHAKIGCMQVRV